MLKLEIFFFTIDFILGNDWIKIMIKERSIIQWFTWYNDLNWEKFRPHLKQFMALLFFPLACRSMWALNMFFVMKCRLHRGCLHVYLGFISTSIGARPGDWWTLFTWLQWVPRWRNFLIQIEHWYPTTLPPPAEPPVLVEVAKLGIGVWIVCTCIGCCWFGIWLVLMTSVFSWDPWTPWWMIPVGCDAIVDCWGCVIVWIVPTPGGRITWEGFPAIAIFCTGAVFGATEATPPILCT